MKTPPHASLNYGEAYSNAACPICNSLGVHFHTYDSHRIDRCSNCGFVYTRDIPSNEFLANYYDAMYQSHCQNGAFIPKKTLGLKHWLLSRLLDKLTRRNYGSPRKLLEIGCSQGVLLKQFQHLKDWEAKGVDFGSQAVKYACSQGLDAHVGDIASMNFSDGEFDAVVAIHVMEHVQNLYHFIKEVHRVTKVGGVFFAVMPSMSHYKAKISGPKWKYWGPPGHLWYFTNHSLRLFLAQNGFEVVHCSSFYHRAHIRVIARRK